MSGYILSQIPGALIEPDLFKYPNSKKLHRHRNLLVAFVHLRGMWCRHTMAEQGQSLRLKVFKYFPAGLDFFFFFWLQCVFNNISVREEIVFATS